MKCYAIAIDGPSASGKSTVAKIVANKLNYLYVDTGAMYRAFTLACLKNNIDPKNENLACSLIGKINISFNKDNKITLNNIDVSKEIRMDNVADNVSYIASYGNVRKELVRLQREIAKNRNVVMDGRDIGSFVLSDADVKIYQIADSNERANRRYKENIEKGMTSSFDEILNNIKKRDYIDSHRKCSPLIAAKDSITIDTTNMSINEVANKILEICKEKGIK